MDSWHYITRNQEYIIRNAVTLYLTGLFSFDELIIETWFVKSMRNAAYYNAVDAQPIV